MLDLERKIEKTIYKATLALDENNWSEFFELCDESFHLRDHIVQPRNKQKYDLF